MYATTALKKISKLKHRNKVVQGSQGAGKTHGILDIWALKAATRDSIEHCTIATDEFPRLRSGPIKDMQEICFKEGIDYTYTKNPAIIKINNWAFEFASFDSEMKGLGPRRDRLFLNEANRLSWTVARPLIVRTHKERIFDFNPTLKFWAHEKFVDVNDCDFIKLTYKDNEKLPQAEIDDIEKHAPWGLVPDENYWRVFGLGEIGFVEGQIFKNYEKYTGVPRYYDDFAYGTDFGWEDPLTTIKVYIDRTNRKLYLREMFYSSQADYEEDYKPAMLTHPEYEPGIMLCDHDKNAIYTLRKKGFQSIMADKSGLIQDGIRIMKQYKIYVHEDSKCLIAEMDAYKWQYNDMLDMFIDRPAKDQQDHAIDAARYATRLLDSR